MHTKEYKHKGKQHGKYSQNKKKLNPLSKIGKYHIVLSVIQKCTGQINALREMTKQQHKTESDQENSEEMKDYADIAKSEVFCCRSFQNSAVIDTACTKTSASQIWLDNFKSNLTEQALKEIETFPSNTSFKLCDCRKVNFLNQIIFLVEIANKFCNAEIVLENIPFLWSKTSLKK